MELLKELCQVRASSGDEENMKNYLLDYIDSHKKNWKVQPEIYADEDQLLNCIILKFGKPTTAIFAHIDSIGFTAKYNNELVKVGGPVVKNGYELIGEDENGLVEGKIEWEEDDSKFFFVTNDDCKTSLTPGTPLTFKCNFRETDNFVQSCYLDNRLGVWSALKTAETLENGAIVFSCWEEHGGGSVGYLARFLHEEFKITQALISDITWVTEGVKPGKGVVISQRDSGIPRRKYIKKIMDIARKNHVNFQLEVEDAGGSDGNVLQRSPYPFDWCFIGAAEQHVHSPDEKVHKKDIEEMVKIYQVLMQEL